MFLDGVEPIRYAAPWDQYVGDRVVALCRRGAERRVAYFYEVPDTSTFRYRAYNMIQVLDSGDGPVAAAWFRKSELEQLLALLPIIDVLVICRVRYTHSVNRLITVARKNHCQTVFDCDDLVFDTDYTHLILNTLDQNLSDMAWDHWYASIGRLGATAKMCDRAIFTNDYLAEKFLAFLPGRDVRVIPNFLNREQMTISRQIYEAKRAGGFRSDGRIHLGYFSGTPTHNKDFAIVSGALARLFARDKRLMLRLVGFMEVPTELKRFADRVDRHELQDFLNLQRLIGATEFNLVPLQDNPFTNCKSELKYFEAAITGTISLASPTYVFRAAIRDGENGYLVNSTDWEERISTAIDKVMSYSDMAEVSFRHADLNYSWTMMGEKVQAALFDE
jgi:glycosyltransferase involved in cell wall biosynthesis